MGHPNWERNLRMDPLALQWCLVGRLESVVQVTLWFLFSRLWVACRSCSFHLPFLGRTGTVSGQSAEEFRGRAGS